MTQLRQSDLPPTHLSTKHRRASEPPGNPQCIKKNEWHWTFDRKKRPGEPRMTTCSDWRTLRFIDCPAYGAQDTHTRDAQGGLEVDCPQCGVRSTVACSIEVITPRHGSPAHVVRQCAHATACRDQCIVVLPKVRKRGKRFIPKRLDLAAFILHSDHSNTLLDKCSLGRCLPLSTTGGAQPAATPRRGTVEHAQSRVSAQKTRMQPLGSMAPSPRSNIQIIAGVEGSPSPWAGACA